MGERMSRVEPWAEHCSLGCDFQVKDKAKQITAKRLDAKRLETEWKEGLLTVSCSSLECCAEQCPLGEASRL